MATSLTIVAVIQIGTIFLPHAFMPEIVKYNFSLPIMK